jgi:hypothetical protein
MRHDMPTDAAEIVEVAVEVIDVRARPRRPAVPTLVVGVYRSPAVHKRLGHVVVPAAVLGIAVDEKHSCYSTVGRRPPLCVEPTAIGGSERGANRR